MLALREPSKCETREQEPVKRCWRRTPTHHISMFVQLSARSAHKARPVSQPRRHVRGPPSSLLQLCYRSVFLRTRPAPLPSSRSHLADSPPRPARPHPQRTQTQPPMDTHCRNVTFNGQCHQSHACMQQSPTQGAVLRV